MRPTVLLSSLATMLLPMSFVVVSHKTHSTKSSVKPALLKPAQLPEAIPQMTRSTECEFNGTWTWVCRDGYTLAASDNGKLHFYRLGRDDYGAHIRPAFMRR